MAAYPRCLSGPERGTTSGLVSSAPVDFCPSVTRLDSTGKSRHGIGKLSRIGRGRCAPQGRPPVQYVAEALRRLQKKVCLVNLRHWWSSYSLSGSTQYFSARIVNSISSSSHGSCLSSRRASLRYRFRLPLRLPIPRATSISTSASRHSVPSLHNQEWATGPEVGLE